MIGVSMLRLLLLLAAGSFLCHVSATNNFIENLVLYDASSNPGVNLGPLVSGMVIDLAKTGSHLTVLAKVNSTVIGYVLFKFDDTFTNKENFPFYALNGNSGSYLNSFQPLTEIGEHTLVAEFYNARTNALVDTITSTFTVMDNSADTNTGPITGFGLVNTISGDEVTLPSIVDLQKYGTSLSILAYTRERLVDDVLFSFDHTFIRVENSYPWAINGNEGARIFPFGSILVPGVHTVTAVAQGFNEEILGNLTFTFIVQNTVPTRTPLRAPIPSPVNRPTLRSGRPTLAPIRVRTLSPSTVEPTIEPTEFEIQPSVMPLSTPSSFPVQTPTEFPHRQTVKPTRAPTRKPNIIFKPSRAPSNSPTMLTSVIPTQAADTIEPTIAPTFQPETNEPTSAPTTTPTLSHVSSVVPTQPFETDAPTEPRTVESSSEPTKLPTLSPVSSNIPTQPFETEEPTQNPTIVLSSEPSSSPTDIPTRTVLTDGPTNDPTSAPVAAPMKKPSLAPLAVPSPISTSISPTPKFENVLISGELRKWHKVTLSFTGPYSSETDSTTNPFMDFRLDVTFIHWVTKKQYIVPGYYAADGNAAETSASNGTQWHCHFSPDEIGFWSYDVSFVAGKDVSVAGGGEPSYFDGASGVFEILKSDKVGRDHRGKGRLRYVGEHHLRFAEGEWFLKAGADRYVATSFFIRIRCLECRTPSHH